MEEAGDELGAPGDFPMTPGGSAKGSQDWCTPSEIGLLVKRCLGKIDLDPFSNYESVIPATWNWIGKDKSGPAYTGRNWAAEDGWSSWPSTAETFFVNPPWKKTQAAIVKCRDEWLRVRGREVIGLFPTGPNCSAWPIVLRAPACCYPRGRIAFLEDGKPKAGNPKDVVIVYWGHDQYRFREVFRELGEVVFG